MSHFVLNAQPRAPPPYTTRIRDALANLALCVSELFEKSDDI